MNDKFITFEVELQVSHSIRTEIPKAGSVRAVESRYRENTANIM